MLTINVPETELFDDGRNAFYTVQPETVNMAHSLLSISKWESQIKKPFIVPERLLSNPKYAPTKEEFIYYIECMIIRGRKQKHMAAVLYHNHLERISHYINDPQTASMIRDGSGGGKPKPVTSELIYAWMIEFGVPFECDRWHLNRLLTLIRVRSAQLNPKKKSKNQQLQEWANLAAQRGGGR